MSAIWAPVIAALGASLLTILGTFGLEWFRSWRAEKSALAERRSRAYTALLAQTIGVMQLAQTLHLTMQFRSGMRETLNMTIGKSKPLDPLELAQWQSKEMQPMFDVWSEVWAVGSKEAIAAANDLVAKCGDVMGAGTQRGTAVPPWLRAVTGEKWSQQQLDQLQAEMRTLAVARKRFGEIARKELGVEKVDLFVSNELGVPGAEQPQVVGTQTADEPKP